MLHMHKQIHDYYQKLAKKVLIQKSYKL